VTSLNSAEARNFGGGEHMAHDARYDRADEFMDVVLGDWNTWEDDALILDKANNRFADPAKVHRLDHVGRYFRSCGPFSVPRAHTVSRTGIRLTI
jgi:alkanesulfonate monooxygenase SsuD/methylene tetrahydromethanopterin reductase-like flavin-dependent oxidoreductase (luciferase family)